MATTIKQDDLSKKLPLLARQSAAEGMVLLKNELETLPLKKNSKISVFGRCQYDTYKSGTGSGGAVHTPYTVNLIEGLKEKTSLILNESLLTTYQEWIKINPFDNGGGGWAAEPWFQKEMPLSDDIVVDASLKSDVALVIIGRTAGEDQDNFNGPGSYQLTELEKDMLNKVTTHFSRVVVLLNVSNIIDMSWVYKVNKPEAITSILYMWHGGMETGRAVADILVGDITPSGKLSDTIAYKLTDYPSHKNFGHKDKNYYEEDVYLGYRYFETFSPQSVQYEFGYGLSYTDFSLEVKEAVMTGHGTEASLEIVVSVSNKGANFNGKEVIQVYYSSPQGQLGQPKVQLGAFKKTKNLAPGEQEDLHLTLSLKTMATYDDSGATGYPSAYLLEKGHYAFYVGNSIRRLKPVLIDNKKYYELNQTLVVEQLSQALAPNEAFKRLKPGCQSGDGTYEVAYEDVPLNKVDLNKRILAKVQSKSNSVKKSISLTDVNNGNSSMQDFVSQLSLEALMTLIKGEGMCSPKTTPGTAAAFGGISEELKGFGIPVMAAADGPSGIRMDSGKKASQVAIGTALACTWNLGLVEEVYEEVGYELKLNAIDTLLGPGLNLHRHPLNGRNFEYFSEDPLLSGCFAYAFVKGLKVHGAHATLKHYLANDQELERHAVDAVVSERALRELHLKAFEIPVRRGNAKSIMTSYNPINGVFAASNYDLNTTILRDEWGFDGIVMTDWWARVNHPVNGGQWSKDKKSHMVRAQNDLYMVVEHNEAVNFEADDINEAIKTGSLTRYELERSAVNILNFALDTFAFSNQQKRVNTKKIQSLKITNEAAYQVDDVILLRKVQKQTVLIKVNQPGSYIIEMQLRYHESPLAQAALNLELNGEYFTTIQLNGSEEDYQPHESSLVDLNKGYYELVIDNVRPGIDYHSLKLKLK
ncbi:MULTISPECIES: glycoside hydrolase family 3 C-terminal domain-containing protein [unclassified Fusibacter]|uniref:glycoside hydrolase family 3 protein n=1 Tax=unclassified Fusibacter TaxID=2624464 RepID=UPI001012E79E|nr:MULTISPECIES: glycoside hydrolase family 3 protein [unclassified Fusibacter]MCK8061667.1 glycoside hydrolase family 3 C-terminal domain-containing protein [Fusibacter sp. A2]NPE23851.1 beta-glucosidase [Fusibacter sp. A1]RXV58566.1 beta-glucosidase [Fusibacter sp. A1]